MIDELMALIKTIITRYKFKQFYAV